MGMRIKQSIARFVAIVGLDSYVRELCDRWLHEDHVEGVAK
jgi:hypothetical protein